MAWKELHEHETRNGRMKLVKFFGTERLLAQDNVQQSGDYMNGVWKTTFSVIPKNFPVEHLVFLGVGLGGGLALAAKRFPNARITGIEWDPTLCTLAKERLNTFPRITIIEQDAETWTSTMPNASITCVDLFTGADVAPCVRNETFITNIIARSTLTCINVYTHQEILAHVDNAVADLPRKRLQYYASTIGLYGSPDVCG